MTIFELLFGLSSLILGLALTHMASAIFKLAHAGRKVSWAPEPILQASIILLVIIFAWANLWGDRSTSSIAYWQLLLQVLKLLALYIAAAACLPEVRESDSNISLYGHYDHTRRLSFGAMVAGLILFQVYGMTDPATAQALHWSWRILGLLGYIAAYVALMFVRRRWVNKLLLGLALVYWASSIMTVRFGA